MTSLHSSLMKAFFQARILVSLDATFTVETTEQHEHSRSRLGRFEEPYKVLLLLRGFDNDLFDIQGAPWWTELRP